MCCRLQGRDVVGGRSLRLRSAWVQVLKACTSLRLEAAGHLFLFLDLSINLQMLRVKTHCLGLVVELTGMDLSWTAILCPWIF